MQLFPSSEDSYNHLERAHKLRTRSIQSSVSRAASVNGMVCSPFIGSIVWPRLSTWMRVDTRCATGALQLSLAKSPIHCSSKLCPCFRGYA